MDYQGYIMAKNRLELEYRGSCDKPKGHCGESIFSAVFVTFVISCFLILILVTHLDEGAQLKREAIQKGYAQYSTKDGRWGWK